MSPTDTSVRKILVLTPDSRDHAELLNLLDQIGNVRVEVDMESLLNAMREDQFDLLVSTSADLLSFDRLGATVRAGDVIEAIGQGVGIFEIDGRVIWSNSVLGQLSAEVWEPIQKHCAENYGGREARSIDTRPRSLRLRTNDEQFYDVMITPILGETHVPVRLVAVVTDVSHSRLLQKKMDAIDNAGRALVRMNTDELARMDARQRLELLEEEVIQYTRELLQFDNFVIRLLDKATQKLELVLSAGLPTEAQQMDIYCTTENSGISGYVAATGRSYICPNVQKDPRYLLGIDNARSSLTVPLRLHDQVIGIFNIESDRVAGFTEDDRQFAEIFGRYVAIALHILDLLVEERSATTGRLADDVTAEIAGPLGDILADTVTLMEDYIGHDELRGRLQVIADNVAKIRECIKQVTRPEGGILGTRVNIPQPDPCLAGQAVLVVDDEEMIRQAIRDVLTQSGCEVEVAREGNEAVALLNRRCYDLVITDIRMPGRSGYDIFQAVKEAHPDCPVIFVTGFGYDPNHSIIRASQEGLAAVLYKPFKVDQLLSEVRAAVSCIN